MSPAVLRVSLRLSRNGSKLENNRKKVCWECSKDSGISSRIDPKREAEESRLGEDPADPQGSYEAESPQEVAPT